MHACVLVFWQPLEMGSPGRTPKQWVDPAPVAVPRLVQHVVCRANSLVLRGGVLALPKHA